MQNELIWNTELYVKNFMLSIPEHIIIKKAMASPLLCVCITSYFAKQNMRSKLRILRHLVMDSSSMAIKMILFEGLKYFDLR